jgi:predicted Zn-ribbon and HTH transcriptional regulator
MRFQRSIEGEKKAHIQDVANALAGLVAQHRYKRIVAVGADKARAVLRGCLTTDVSRRMIDGERVDSRSADHELLQTAVDYFRKAENEEEGAKVERVIREIHSSSMGVSGLDDTLKCLARGQAYEVLVASDLKQAGAECENCGMLFAQPASTCQACESDQITKADLKEAITRAALKYGTRLEFVKLPDFRAKLGGAAALLRSPRL